MKILFRLFGALLILMLVYVVGVLAFGTYHDWHPPKTMPLEGERSIEARPVPDSLLRFLIWNIGYAGLGAECTFFFDGRGFLTDGGRMVIPPQDLSEKNLGGILTQAANVEVDFLLLQEIDWKAKRSYYQNQYEQIGEQVPNFYAGFAPNYQAPWVPLPLLQPWETLGEVKSGLATYSRYQPSVTERHQLPGEYGWPTRIFQLDRCLAVQRYPLSNGKELVVINVHNSAFDDGSIKALQMEYLKTFVLREYQVNGNYVVAGGDWNQCPPYFKADGFMFKGYEGGYEARNIDPAFLPPEWQWIYDPVNPTNRSVQAPYVAGETFVTILDFYLLSPNLRVKQVKTLHQDFRFSDHQAVYLEATLLN